MQRVDGEQLLKTNEMMAIHEFKIEDDDDRKYFMQCKRKSFRLLSTLLTLNKNSIY